MAKRGKCLACDHANAEIVDRTSYYDVICKWCGKYTLLQSEAELDYFDKNKLAVFLFYYGSNEIFEENTGYCYLVGKDKPKQSSDMYRLVMPDILEGWWPQNFSEKIDTILLRLSKLSQYNGQEIILKWEESLRLFFVNLFIDNRRATNPERYEQLQFIFTYMQETQNYFDGNMASSPYVDQFTKKPEGTPSKIKIKPEGLKRIDDLQKNQVNSKKVFVAMGYSDKDGKPRTDTREAIRNAINKAGFEEDFLDEHEHNNQIVPEMLYRIRQSRFVIADLTYCNNGAYYEAGYAAGLGKEVIHLCQNDDFHEAGHFDVKQKATILWKNEQEIEDKLYKRILATIS